MALDLSTLPEQDQIAAIYIGYYDRAAEPQGSDFWVGALNNPDISLSDIADQFSGQDETLEVHPFFSDPSAETSAAFITEVYLNLFNREPDEAGLTFWSGVLLDAINGTGDSTVGEIILQIIEGAVDGPDGNDRTTVLNKIEVASSWTDGAEEAGLSDTAFADLDADVQESAKTIIEPVTDSPATVVAAKSEIDDIFEPAPVPGDEILLTSDTDVLTGSDNDDEFNAYIQQNPFAGGISNSLSSADRLDGGAGNDRLYAELTEEFIGVNGANEIDIQPRIRKIEEIDIEARDSDGNSNTGAITVDAKNITDHEEIGSYYSDGDLYIENLTTLLDSGAARNTADITVTMDHTDNFNSDNDASDLTVYFDNDYLLAGETSVGQADFFLLDQDAELRLLTGQAAEGRLDEIGNNGIRFIINGVEVDVTFDGALLDEDAPNEINDHDPFIAALQADLQAEIAAGNLPEGTQIVRFDYPNVIFDADGLALNRAALQDGSFSDLIPAIRVISGDGSPVTPLGFTVPTEDQPPFNVFGRVTADFEQADEPITVDIELEKAGRGGEGGDLIIGGKAQNAPDAGIADGIEVFNISVKGIGGDGALAKPSNVGTITSTGNELETINIVTDPAYASGDSYANLIVRNGFDQDTNANVETGDLKLVNANGFLGDLVLGDIDANMNAGRITNLDTLTALGGGDIEFNAYLDGTEVNQDYTYTTGSGSDTVNVIAAGDALDYADSGLRINTGEGGDSVSVNFAFDAEDNSNNQLNQAIIDDVVVETGGGNDTVRVDGVGVANILAGAGDDKVYTDGAGNKAIWAFNFDDIRADQQGLGNITADDLPGVQPSLAYVGGATITVTLSGAGLNGNTAAGGGVMALDTDDAPGAIAYADGYEGTAIVTVGSSNDYYGTQVDVNNAVIAAIENSVLNDLVSVSIAADNTLIVVSKTSGAFAPEDLRIEIDQQDATSSTYANAVLSEAQSVFQNSDLTLTDLWGTTSFASPASYQAGAPAGEAGDLTNGTGTNAWYDGLSADGEVANQANDNLHTAGTADATENDNVIDAGPGNDLIVLSTDAVADGVTPFTTSSQNALIDGASNETIVLTTDNFGNDYVMNFTTYGGTAAPTAGIDFLDFTSYLTSMQNLSAAAGNASDTLIPVTYDTNLADVQANEVAVVRFDNTDDSGETFANLSASVVEQLFNNGASYTGFAGDQNYGNLAASAANADDEYTQTANTDQLINGSAYSIVMIENNDNRGEYKVFKLSWNGDATNDADSSNNGVVTATALGSLDFGDSLSGLAEANFVGSDAYAALLAAGLNGGGNPGGGGGGGNTVVDLSGQTNVAAVDGTAEDFVLSFDSGSGNALSSDAVVAITGFNPAEDTLVFDDANAPPQDPAVFLNGAGGAVVASNGFAGTTTVSFQDDNGADAIPAASVTLVGITDATLGGGTPFFEVV